MTLATRCTSCGTTFKVVQDQLKVSAGWVRCGRCNEVFNAIEGLFEVGAVTSAPTATTATIAPMATVATLAAPANPLPTTREIPAGVAGVAKAAAPPAADPAAELTPPAPESVSVLVPVSAALPESPAQVAGWRVEVSAPAPTPAVPNDSREHAPEQAPETTTELTPGFVRQADRAQRWRRPGVRLALAAAALLLTLSFAAQLALQYRDTLAAEWPASRPWLVQACELTGCSIEPLRRIAALSVESSGLDQLGSTTIYKLSAVLRNRGDVELMLPALDLVLSDAQGAVISRRVLSATELGSPSRTLAARGELSLQASLNAGDRRVAGYTIEIFYP